MTKMDQTDDTQTFNLTPIQEFYRDTSIFITGSTGFVGRILLEKLLRSCTNIATIYLLVRNKNGKEVSTRVDEIIDDVIFDRLKKECPNIREKIIGIAGNCYLPDLGLSSQDRTFLMNEVNVVFHIAATVRFNEKLKTAVAVNVTATHELMKLAQQMLRLKSFMYVSTAFSNCPNDVIEEKIFPSSIDFSNIMTITQTLSDEILDIITPQLLDKMPNTYCFSKQIAEAVVQHCGRGLPVGIFRPSIIISTYKEPVRGWINNVYGPTAICSGVWSGIIRAIHCNPECEANLVPVDMCVNSLIAAAWDVGTNFNAARNIPTDSEIAVYNYESSCHPKPINWRYFIDTSLKYGDLTPSLTAAWYMSFTLVKSYYLYLLLAFFVHTVPAVILDVVLVCTGRSPRFGKIYSKIHKKIMLLNYFATTTCTFRSRNTQNLIKKMSDEDQEIFFCDIKKLDWEEFFQYYVRGVRIYLMNDTLDTLEVAKTRWKRLYWAHQLIKMVIGLILFRTLWCVGCTFLY